jgi:hypothetical protein
MPDIDSLPQKMIHWNLLLFGGHSEIEDAQALVIFRVKEEY